MSIRRYEAVLDITLALAFLSLGIFPLAWLPSGTVGERTGFPKRWNYTISDQLFENRYDLRTSTAMGWICLYFSHPILIRFSAENLTPVITCSIMFTGLAALNISMVTRLNMFGRIVKSVVARDPLVENTPVLVPISTTGSYRRDHTSLRERSLDMNNV